MDVDKNGNNKSILAFALIIIMALAIAGFNWAKNFKYTIKKTREQQESEEKLKKNFEELKNVFSYGIEELKNKSKDIISYGKNYAYGQIEQMNENKIQYNTQYGYGYGDINYQELLKDIKPEDIEQYLKDYNEIDDTLKNLEDN